MLPNYKIYEKLLHEHVDIFYNCSVTEILCKTFYKYRD